MTKEIYEVLTIVALVAAPICSILAVLIANIIQNRYVNRKDKLYILGILMSERLKWTKDGVRVLNLIDVVFYKSEGVKTAFQNYNNQLKFSENKEEIHKKYIVLLFEIAKDLGYKEINLDTIISPCIPLEYANTLEDDEIRKNIELNTMIKANGLVESLPNIAESLFRKPHSKPQNSNRNNSKRKGK